VRPGLAGSYAATFHAAQPSRFLLVRDDGESATQGLREPRIERAIGVIYPPRARYECIPCGVDGQVGAEAARRTSA